MRWRSFWGSCAAGKDGKSSSGMVGKAMVVVVAALGCCRWPGVVLSVGGCGKWRILCVACRVSEVSLGPYRFLAQPVAICRATGFGGVVDMVSIVCL